MNNRDKTSWPASVGEVDAQWLSAAMSSSFQSEVTIESFAASRVGTGQVGECWRLCLTYAVSEGGPDKRPSSVIAKFAASDPASRAAGASQSCYVREVGFYRDLQSRIRTRTPLVHFQAIADNTVDHVLLLEDMAPAVQGDQLLGCSIAQAQVALEQLGLLHAPLWDDPSLGALDWLEAPTAEGRKQVLGLFVSSHAGFIERFEATLEPDTVTVVRWLANNAARLKEYAGPVAPVHNDYRVDNLLFGDGVSAPAVTAVDWQTIKLGCGPHDAAYFLGAGLAPDVRREHERKLLETSYYETLLAQGVRDYDFDACWLDYRRGAFGGLLMAVIASMLVGSTGRGDAMFLTMANRHATHALDVDAMKAVL